MKNKSLRVLIIDDSENDALLIIRELKKGGYNPVYERVETSASMKKSLKKAMGRNPLRLYNAEIQRSLGHCPVKENKNRCSCHHYIRSYR